MAVIFIKENTNNIFIKENTNNILYCLYYKLKINALA